jgi:periplasmic divalent cation tolerance protein
VEIPDQGSKDRGIEGSGTGVVIVLTTIDADPDAAVLAKTLVDERLAACVNVFPPMVSVYRWKGKVAQGREQQLVIKTTPERVAALETRLRALHPYELPEFIVLSGTASAAYAAWARESVEPDKAGPHD